MESDRVHVRRIDGRYPANAGPFDPEKMDHMRRTIARMNDPTTSDEQRESLREEFTTDVLSVEPLRALKITLSWGGPSDGYRLLFDTDDEQALSGVYWYADWFTYAET